MRAICVQGGRGVKKGRGHKFFLQAYQLVKIKSDQIPATLKRGHIMIIAEKGKGTTEKIGGNYVWLLCNRLCARTKMRANVKLNVFVISE